MPPNPIAHGCGIFSGQRLHSAGVHGPAKQGESVSMVTLNLHKTFSSDPCSHEHPTLLPATLNASPHPKAAFLKAPVGKAATLEQPNVSSLSTATPQQPRHSNAAAPPGYASKNYDQVPQLSTDPP